MKTNKHESWHETAEDLRAKLSRYAAKPRFNEEFEDAFAFFFGEGPDEIQDELEPAAFSRFMEWFIHDYRLSNGHRLIELFAMEFSIELTSRMRVLLESWQKSYLTLLQLLQLGRETAQVRDLLLGGEYSVCLPPPASTQGTPEAGRLLIGRLTRVGDRWEIPGGATVLPERLRERLLQLIRGEFRRFHRNRGGGWQEFLHEQGFMFNDLIDNLGDEIDLDDTPVYMRAIYDISDMQACVRAMRGAVEPTKVVQRRGEVSLAPQVAQWPGMRGELRLADGRLEVVCGSQDEFAATKQAINARLGLAVRHRIDVFERRAESQSKRPLLRSVNAATHIDLPVQSIGHEDVEVHQALVETAATSEISGAQDGANIGKSGQVAEAADVQLPDAHLVTACPAAVQQPELYTDEQREVARLFSKVLMQTGVSQEHLDSAMWIWADFCKAEQPRVRQTAGWAAAVHITLGRVEGWRLRNTALAQLYGVKPATVSRHAALIAATLDVNQFDDRYCVEHPVDGLLKRLGEVGELDDPRQAEEILGAGVNAVPADQTELLARLVQVRGALAAYAQRLEHLGRRAHEHFFSQVGCPPDDTFWQDCFQDWFHFDWAVPVRGGLTVLEEALESGELPPDYIDALFRWKECHPAYYIVDSVQSAGAKSGVASLMRLTLHPMRGTGKQEVIWPLSAASLKKGDGILVRLVELDGVTTCIGHAMHFNALMAEAIQLRLDEEQALLEHWNGRHMKWEEISARYAERLYAIAYRAARGFPDEE